MRLQRRYWRWTEGPEGTVEGFPSGRPEWMRRGLTREMGVSVMNDIGGLKGQ